MKDAKSDVVAILISDIHLSHTCPPARSPEPDWYAAMKRPLDQVRELQSKHKCNVVVAGDIFHRWNPPPELINFAIEYLPDDMIAIPGQHDLPHHNLEEIHRSGYATLEHAGKIISHRCMEWLREEWYACLFPFGQEVVPVQAIPGATSKGKNLAVIHSYIWKQGCGYPGAPKDAKVGSWVDRLASYDAAVFGDNHIGFIGAFPNDRVFMNCGCLIPRRSEERWYQPGVGLLRVDGSIHTKFIDTKEDKWLEQETVPEVEVDVSDVIEELKGMDVDSLDFEHVVRRYLMDKGIEAGVRNLVIRLLEEGPK